MLNKETFRMWSSLYIGYLNLDRIQYNILRAF